MQHSPSRDLPWLRVTMARPACCLVCQPPLHCPDLAWHSPALPCPGQQLTLRRLQVDYLGAELSSELRTSRLACAAADHPCRAVGHGGYAVDRVAHGGGAELILVEDQVTGFGVVAGVGGLACAGRPGDEDDASHHAVTCLGGGSPPAPLAGSPTCRLHGVHAATRRLSS